MAGSKPGERRGGRRKGTPNSKTKELQARVEAEGVTPLDVMLDNMRFAHRQAGEVLAKILGVPAPEIDDFKMLLQLRQVAQDCAKDAAPYVHPKLASVEHTGKDGGAMIVEIVRFGAGPSAG